ncbi:MAG: hypothetical protein GF383_07075 [Candidatus Lokiarchaeota archaeon]|nr:hypothetical protein [Candidatus Lokiarchaeota archaeon]MBD3339923.1 hypothetical protein [Candidatus Lokiarchaeota archaeon]
MLKIICGGFSGSGKTTFLNGPSNPFSEEDFLQLGVSFKLIEGIIDKKHSCLLQIWDLKGIDEFKCLYPSYCKGAKGAILCFDTTDKQSLKKLTYWISIIRQNAGKIPIILIGTRGDLKNEINPEEIKEFIEKYNLDGIFITSINYDIREKVFRHLIEKVSKPVNISNFRITIPQFDAKFYKFVKFYERCPLCGRKNHFSYLKKIYLSDDKEIVKIRKSLLKVMDKSNRFSDEIHNKHLRLGIPCCVCFNIYFKEQQVQ